MNLAPVTALTIHIATAILTVAAAMMLAAALRERPRPDLRPSPYESGILPRGMPRERIGIPFFLLAVFFVIFDMEVALLFTWAVAARDAGLVGLVEAAIFIGVLLAALAYLWLDGALRISPERPRRSR